ncbi:tRNA sulfurtransferase [Haloarculaceae archaeon H-GB2-1]|nr:tRNA sulfurtransferase [Haloarculaceae archaeon H-GB1-1]MEA5386634.1 tRNA sulfurtransferase [Haloarculaceae archaeon H-GB11]MEA5408159.1 tRNA sulfurtransferase [Haloarculaceae archaeon H-GB2-1]
MHPPGADTVVVRHGEIGVKSEQVRRKMEQRLYDHVQAILDDRDVPGTVEQRRNRLYVHTDESAVEAATEAVSDVFGVVSASPAVVVDPEMDSICETLAAAARDHYDGGSFAIDARRAGHADEHEFTSEDLERRGGSAVWDAVDFDPEVDLDDPDLTFYVEARPDVAYVFLEKREGPGGLPLGTQEPMVALVSGGIDSPVAAWRAMKRGIPVIPVYLDLGRYGGPDHRARAEATVSDLSRYAPHHDMRLRVIPAGDAVERIATSVEKDRMLAFRRFMFRAAERVARDENAVGIVTGEAVGQKSSQTTANLAVTSEATTLPVHRPLLTADKTDITEQARAIGTYTESTIPAGCNRLAPSFPETNADLDEVREVEPDELFELAREAAASVEVTDPFEG